MKNSDKKAVRAFLIGPLTCPSRRSLAVGGVLPNSGECVIAVDGGWKQCRRLGLKPNAVVGDWDSLRTSPPSNVPSITLPVNKDRSDTWAGAQLLAQTHATEWIVLGMCGGRIDHELAAWLDFSDLLTHSKRVVRIHMVGTERQTWLFSGLPEGRSHILNIPVGSTVSLFSLGPRVEGLKLQGFKYPLRARAEFSLKSSSQGLSNVTRAGRQKLSLRRGTLLVIADKIAADGRTLRS